MSVAIGLSFVMGLLSNAKFQRVDQMSRKYQEIRDCIHLEHTVSPCWGRFSVGTLTDSLPPDQKISMASRDVIVGTYSSREGVGNPCLSAPEREV